jgi:hypothetical protein
MDTEGPMGTELMVAVGLVVLLLISLEIGYRSGQSAASQGPKEGGTQVGAVQGAILGLLGLLLGFSFAGAAARFIERQDLIVQEANAIGTAWLRADVLDEPHRGALKDALREYTAHRVEVSSKLKGGLGEQAQQEIEVFHRRMWRAASAGSLEKPATMVVTLPPVNDVIDLHSTRVAAGKRHVPLVVMVLLVACSMLAIGVIGYGSGMSGRRHIVMTGSLVLLIGATLWTTIDLDYPRAGMIQLNDGPLRQLNLDPGGATPTGGSSTDR